MTQSRLDVLGIGNAVVDVLAQVDDGFLTIQGLDKGSMTLIDAETADRLYGAMPPGIECSGGSAANTIAGLASLGARAGFVGKVRDDQLGAVFTHDVRSLGVAFATAPATQGAATARCLVLVTPDAQRTMQTYLGACVALGPDDVDEAVVAGAAVTYLEGYLWDPPQAKEAFRKAMHHAHAAGRRVALSLSDPFCVDRHREEFRDLVENHVDVLFANEAEIVSLYQAASFDEVVSQVGRLSAICALTRSEKGSVVVHGAETHEVPAARVGEVVDTTGAGDLYAAGFLHGLTRDRGLKECASLGGLCAAEVISHIGARPRTDLRTLVGQAVA